MHTGTALAFAAAAFALMAPTSPAPQTQRRGEITFFSQIGFMGQRFTVTGPRETLNIPWRVRSATVANGEQWDICSQSRYRSCIRVTETQGNILWTVASARPVNVAPPPPPPPPSGGTQSLRGMSAEFFVAPRDSRGNRVESCQSGAASCAAQAADRFCVSRGWTAASYHRQETVNRRNTLTDVLCTRTR